MMQMHTTTYFLRALQKAFALRKFTVKRNSALPNVISKSPIYAYRKALLNEDHFFVFDFGRDLGHNLESLALTHRHVRHFVRSLHRTPAPLRLRTPIIATVAASLRDVAPDVLNHFQENFVVPLFEEDLGEESSALFLINIPRQAIISLEPPELHNPIPVERGIAVMEEVCAIAFRA
jgi:hypothetical protein